MGAFEIIDRLVYLHDILRALAQYVCLDNL